jgi:transposase
MGERLRACASDNFGVDMLAGGKISEALQQILKPLLTMIDHLSRQIAAYDQQIEAMAKQYPQVELLTQLYGVGNLIGLTYLLTIEDPGRFRVSRDIGPYLGLVPKQRDSGNSQPQMHITKEGDRYVRKLLVQAAQCMVKKGAPETDLQRWAVGHFRPGDKKGKKKAVVGLARRIAVLLHKLWANGEVYDPNYQREQQRQARGKAA